MKRLYNRHIALLVLMLTVYAVASAQSLVPLKATAKLDTTAIMIGDQIGLDLSLEVPAGSHVTWPVLRDTLVPHVLLVKRGKVKQVRKNNAQIFTRHLTITSFDSGYYDITPIKFKVKLPGTQKAEDVATQDLFLQVYTPVVDTTKPFKPIVGPIAEPYTLGEILPWVLLGLLVIAGVFFLIWYLRRRKKNQPLFGWKAKPKLPPHEEAIKRLEEIRLARMWQAGKLKAYHSAITDIMRDYFARRFFFDAREMTTGQIIQNLEKETTVNKEALGKIKNTFELADLVKFAKLRPSPLENDSSLNYCIDFVNETKVVPQETTEDDKEGETPAKERQAQPDEKMKPDNEKVKPDNKEEKA